MERRHFLRSLFAAGVAATLNPEQLLWTPKVMITVPAMPLKIKAYDHSVDSLTYMLKEIYAPHIKSVLMRDSIFLANMAQLKQERQILETLQRG